MSREIEKLFLDEVRSKKRTANGVYSKTGKNGYVGKMLFASDLMSRKEKTKHRKAGKVESYNMYETILTKEEFEQKDEQTQKAMLTRWREIYKVRDIQLGLGVASKTFYDYLKKHEIPEISRGTRRRGELKNAGTKPAKKQKTPATKEEAPQTPINEVDIKESAKENTIKLLSNGLHLEYNGTYDHEQLNKIFTKLQLITDGEENKFTLSISLSERQ